MSLQLKLFYLNVKYNNSLIKEFTDDYYFYTPYYKQKGSIFYRGIKGIDLNYEELEILYNR